MQCAQRFAPGGNVSCQRSGGGGGGGTGGGGGAKEAGGGGGGKGTAALSGVPVVEGMGSCTRRHEGQKKAPVSMSAPQWMHFGTSSGVDRAYITFWEGTFVK